MRITIDTKTDSEHEIRKAISLLSSLVGDKEVFTNSERQANIFDSPTPEVGNMMSLFDNPETPTTPTPETTVIEPETEKKDPPVEFY